MRVKRFKVEKVLVLGSGAIQIGQAGEFDYSGSQTIKALKEEGIETVLINPNIATIQTSDHLADKVYFLPLDIHFVEEIIAKEKPDGILLGFGGQTALNVGVELSEKGILGERDIKVLGTPISAIQKTEDRDLFVKELEQMHLKAPVSQAVNGIEEAVRVAERITYPVMCRVAYALGGLGSGVVHNQAELIALAKKAFAFTKQILVEEYLEGWKELEYEVVRDRYNNCIVVCSMENADPMGIHTGESIVVAPVQTLQASENFKLRSIAIKVARQLGIIGECNIQFALDPHSEDYRIIELNARLSRSSALASKATGYPLAFIATKLALGYGLTEIDNMITKETSACFEPALDYVVVKYPRWDLQKFRNVSLHIGSEMKSVGEVMAIARTFEEAIQKSIRMLDIGMNGLVCNGLTFDDLEKELMEPTDKRVFAIVEAIKDGYSIDRIYRLSKVDPWFLYKIRNIVEIEKGLARYTLENLPTSLLKEAKEKGFSDLQIAKITESTEQEVREARKKQGIIPFVKQIDTLAAEYPAKTNYLYLTYNGTEDDLAFHEERQVIVLGGGAYRIGSSVEFDWCCVNTVMTLKKLSYRTIMINNNPETVSTDYDICDKLYFDELTLERVLDICEKENPIGVIVSMGGQIPNNLALPLDNAGVQILGTSPRDIDRAEDRHKFSQLLDTLEIDQPEWKELTTIEEAETFANKVRYPVLIRPSYVLSGAAMSIALSKEELKDYLKIASKVNEEHPVVISKFITRAKEIEIDAVAKEGELYCYAISEHIENAGVHSGDATMVLPPQRTYLETMRKIKMVSRKIAKSLNITGPFNMQFIAKDNDVRVIECNLRSSRSFPFVSKVFKINFIDLATRMIMGEDVSPIDRSAFDLDYVGVKAPQFSFIRLKGSDPIMGVDMASTGEVACLGDDFNEAFLKSLMSVGFKLPKKTILLSTGPVDSKANFLPSTRILEEMGFEFYATKGTAEFMAANGIEAKVLHWPLENKKPNVLSYISDGKIDLVINIPKDIEKEELDNYYLIRRKAVDLNIPLITNLQLAKRFVEAIHKTPLEALKIKCWHEYI
ncbi:MAG: carbamoyl-phosphate synthase (glutamine-hydrolyzing) large subunit [Deltaproteobacteria bacterium]|nr:carbamoyl-phosphate synthase (glutamine-hydrolyzing) large subunit [Deltaproteobacteria bacterium]MBW2311483.1 carbamoyl-phosphate synthase (glutamine-hydrolyzing) large subunit [Deltaproteobacteria bacterium]